MSNAYTEIFRSPRSSDCEDRAFVLTAVGIPSVVGFDGSEFLLQVDPSDVTRALAHLKQFETESRPAPPAPPPQRLHPNAWIGCVIYVAVLIGVAFMISNGLGRLDAFDVGELDAGKVQSGQWWRAWTALTLHVDAAHLAGNLAAGAWLGYLAARLIGSGAAWLLIVTGAAFANLLEALLGPPTHRAVGASTAVFTALGLLAAHSWRARMSLSQKWAWRWGPLVAGVVLLGLTGSEGERTDIVAHVIGFGVGIAVGATAALPSVRRALSRVPQWLTGLTAFASIVIAWTCALIS
jgi:membrane associated rhomboid family serine protease